MAEPAASVSPQPLPPIPPPPVPPVTEKRVGDTRAAVQDPSAADQFSRAVRLRRRRPPRRHPRPLRVRLHRSAPATPVDNKIHVVPPPAAAPAPRSTQAALARQVSQMVAAAKENLDKTLRRGAEQAITEEMTVARQQLDAQLHETVEKAIKVSMDRVSESAVKKVVQQAADRTSAIVEEARKATETSTSQLDEKVRNAVQQAVSQAAEQAAHQAAQQTAAHQFETIRGRGGRARPARPGSLHAVSRNPLLSRGRPESSGTVAQESRGNRADGAQ